MEYSFADCKQSKKFDWNSCFIDQIGQVNNGLLQLSK